MFASLCSHCSSTATQVLTVILPDGECDICGNIGKLTAVSPGFARDRMCDLLMEEFSTQPLGGIRTRPSPGMKSDMPIFDRATAKIIGVTPPPPKDWSK